MVDIQNYEVVLPNVERVELKNVEDLEWLIGVMGLGYPFKTVHKYEGNGSDKLKLNEKKTSIIYDVWRSGYGNSYDVNTYTLASVGDWVLWNQRGTAYVVTPHRNSTEDYVPPVPEELLKLIVIYPSGD